LKDAKLCADTAKTSLLFKFKTTKMFECVSECGVECKCFMLVYNNTNFICQLYDITAKNHLVPGSKVNPEKTLMYKTNYGNSKLDLFLKIIVYDDTLINLIILFFIIL